jgi:hypothetical protein
MIRISLKNMAGEIFPMEVDPSSSLLEIAQLASAQDPEQFPPGRTKIMRMDEEQKEDLTADETLLVVITEGPRLESGVFPQDGKPYDRWVIPFRERTLYLYTFQNHFRSFSSSGYAASWSSEVKRPSMLFTSNVLYDLIRILVADNDLTKIHTSDVTPQEMKMLYDIVIPYYQELDNKTGHLTEHLYNSSEPVSCECGSIVKRNSLRTHVHTRKHKAGVKAQ